MDDVENMINFSDMSEMIDIKRAATAPLALLGATVVVFTSWTASAQQPAGSGQPLPWEVNLQTPVTTIAEQMGEFHNLLMIIITIITLFVTALLAWVAIRYNAKANPTPSKNSHNTFLEVAWTVLPIFILIVIAVPSFKLLYAQHTFPTPNLTIKATGYQWYWSYQYPDRDIEFDAYMVPEEELKPGQPRLLQTDNEVVVPAGAVVQVLVTAGDVMHNWTVPSFGSKIDAVPGRVTRTWFKTDTEGVYYGQCSELCGVQHAFMPITVRVVDSGTYDQWTVAMADGNETGARDVITAYVERKKERDVAATQAADAALN